MTAEPEKTSEQVIREDGRYPIEAFGFLHEGLERAVQSVHGGEGAPPPGQRHVSGQQLCLAMRDLASDRYGQLARTVLHRWNIRQTLDFGNMVYLLIESGFMKKTEEDSLEDFRNVFDFEGAFTFHENFEIKQ